MTEAEEGGRIFFTSTGRSLVEEDEIVILSVGVDIGSSTSHLVFSRIVLERLDSRYVVSAREMFYQSDILLTPYCGVEEIDAQALGAFIEREYRNADIDPDEIDTGALILTGVAVRRRNARAIGELFARQAGKMVAVSAGDSLETVLAAHGSGAVARSLREQASVMNVDVGGGTAKIAICRDGEVSDITALDVGARLICFDAEGCITRIEDAGYRFAAELGLDIAVGAKLSEVAHRTLAACMADRLFEAMRGGVPTAGGVALLRLDPLSASAAAVDQVTLSGGVAEYIYGREQANFGDLGSPLAEEIRARLKMWAPRLAPTSAGIRATVIGASQYTTQVSGSTIYVSPLAALPLRNVPVIAPFTALDVEAIDPGTVAHAIKSILQRLDLAAGDMPVALFVPWRGSVTYQRLDDFCRGVVEGLASLLARGHPLLLAGDGDVGGLMGIHLREEMRLANPIVSVDGLELKAFDYIDIGAMLPNSGAVPVVIKSLIFPISATAGMERQPAPRTIGAPV
jgi:ethanolamine utilization protein EutA (predicted chaperonin)